MINSLSNSQYQEIIDRVIRYQDEHHSVMTPNDLHFYADVFQPMFESKSHPYGAQRYLREAYGANWNNSEKFNKFSDKYRQFSDQFTSQDALLENPHLAPLITPQRIENFSLDSVYRKQSLLRRCDGSMHDDSSLGIIIGSNSLTYIIGHLISVDDVEALEQAMSKPIARRYLAGGRLEKLLKDTILPDDSKCYSLIYGNDKNSAFAYLSRLLAVDKNHSVEQVDAIYVPAMARIVGHEFFFHKLNTIVEGDGARHLFKRLVEDGADWYVGFKQIQLGHHTHFSLRDRARNTENELKEFISGISSIWSYTGTLPRSGLGMLVSALDPESVALGIKNSSDAKKIYAMTGNKYFLPLCTKTQRRNFLAEGLGL